MLTTLSGEDHWATDELESMWSDKLNLIFILLYKAMAETKFRIRNRNQLKLFFHFVISDTKGIKVSKIEVCLFQLNLQSGPLLCILWAFK